MIPVYVTNRSPKLIAFPYCGEMHEFPVGETVEILEDAARHIFGYGVEDKEPYLTQLGMIKTRNDLDEAMAILERVEISAEMPVKNRNLSPLVERVPLPDARKARGNIPANA